MKKTWWTRLVSLALAGMMLAPAAAQAAGPGDSFYQSLSQLLNSRDDSFYFDSMELTLGSSILTLDGVERQMDAAPDVQNNRTMLPIRAVAEAAGARVDYDAQSETVVITGPYGDEIRCPIGASSMTVNAEACTLDAPSYAKDGRTYLPVRAVAEALDLEVTWDQAASKVVITAPYQSARVLAWAEKLDTGDLNASTVLSDGTGLWVLQFRTPAEAKQAVERLRTRGVTAGPDRYIPPVEEQAAGTAAQGGPYSWGVEDCGFDTFVERCSGLFTGSGVVAVVDTGVDGSHPFLAGKVLSGRDFVDGDDDPDDGHYHGTHVAGTVIDCAGTAPVRILPVRVLDSRGSGYDSTVAAGIKYAADQGADVINLSLGGSRGSGDDSIDAALSYAVGKGTLVVAAAGNESDDTARHCPAHVTAPGTVVVSAGDSRHAKAYFTNYGESVDCMAPGVDIKSAAPGSAYKTLSGTSMAAPHAAAAAVLLDLAWGKSLSPAELEAKVRTATANGTWTDKYTGCGFLDLSRASVPDGTVPSPAPTPAPSPSPAPGAPEAVSYRYSVSSLSLRAGETAGLTVTAVYADGTTKDVTGSCGLYSTDTEVATVSGGTVTARKTGTARISMGTVPNSVGLPAPVTVTVTEQAAPVVASYAISPASLSMAEGETAGLTVTAVYTDGSRKDVTGSCGLYSTDTGVATVSGGIVTAQKAGTARISISAVPDGVALPEPVPVTVTAASPDTSYKRLFWGISGTSGAATSLTLSQGRSVQADIYGETASGAIVRLTQECQPYSSDPSVITVGADGTVTAVGPGYAYLWLKSAPNNGLQLPPLLEVEVK